MKNQKLNNDLESIERFERIINGKNLMDNRYMSAFFNGFDEGVELVLQIVLDKNDLKVVNSKAQCELSNLHGRTIRLDIIATDADGARYNIEIQKKNEGAGCKRARYHSSMLDANMPEFIGEEHFDVLPRTIVIFICENDFFGAGKPLYTIRRRVEETGELFDDDSIIIYVNGDVKNHESELGRLMEDFFNPDPRTMNYDVLADQAKKMKNIDGAGGDYMKIVREYLTEEEWDTALEEGREEGTKIGTEIGLETGINGMIQDNLEEKTPVERIIFKLGKYYNLQPDEAMTRIEQVKEGM